MLEHDYAELFAQIHVQSKILMQNGLAHLKAQSEYTLYEERTKISNIDIKDVNRKVTFVVPGVNKCNNQIQMKANANTEFYLVIFWLTEFKTVICLEY